MIIKNLYGNINELICNYFEINFELNVNNIKEKYMLLLNNDRCLQVNLNFVHRKIDE